MTTPVERQAFAATRRAFLWGAPIALAAGLAVLAAVWLLANVLSALPQAGAVGTHASLRVLAMPGTQPSGTPRAGTTVPEASEVFAGRETVVDEPAPTF